MNDSNICRNCGGNGYTDGGRKICDNCLGVGKFYLRPSNSETDLRLAKRSTIAMIVVGMVITAMIFSTGQVKIKWIFLIFFTFIWTYMSCAGSFLVNYSIKFGHLFYRPHVK